MYDKLALIKKGKSENFSIAAKKIVDDDDYFNVCIATILKKVLYKSYPTIDGKSLCGYCIKGM